MNKNKHMKQIITYVLAFSMILNITLMVNAKYVKANESSTIETVAKEENNMADNYDVQITYKVTSKWDGHCNLDVTLSNILDEKIDNWEITIPTSFTIENIWNARIISHENGKYTIHNVECNQDILIDGQVTFGMTVACSGIVELPEYSLVNKVCVPVENCKVDYVEYSNWDDQINGKIVITNTGTEKIEDWSFELECNYNITNIWNAEIEYFEEDDTYYYEIKNTVNNQNIDKGQSVEFGFIATCSEKAEIFNKEVFQMGNYLKEFTENEIDDPYDYEDSECIYDADYFESRDEYEKYINNTIPTTRSMRTRKVSKPKLTPIPCTLSMKFNLASTEKAIQNYLPIAGGVYTLQHKASKNAGVNNALLRTAKTSGNMYTSFSNATDLVGFAHGQTFEQFVINGQEYYLLAGNAYKGFSRELAIMKKEKFEEISQSNRYVYNSWKSNKQDFLRITDLEYSNKKGTKSGKGFIHRVDAALTADGKTLVIWKRLTNGTTEICLYNMSRLRKKCFSNGFQGAFSFNPKNKALKKEIKNCCYGSFYETEDNSKILHPNKSFQSIDIERLSNSKWDVYITSGNEKGKSSKPVTLTKIEFSKKGKKLGYDVYREYIAFPGISQENIFFELEGGHIVGNNLDFVIVKYHTKSDKEQYLATISLDKIITPYKK